MTHSLTTQLKRIAIPISNADAIRFNWNVFDFDWFVMRRLHSASFSARGKAQFIYRQSVDATGQIDLEKSDREGERRNQHRKCRSIYFSRECPAGMSMAYQCGGPLAVINWKAESRRANLSISDCSIDDIALPWTRPDKGTFAFVLLPLPQARISFRFIIKCFLSCCTCADYFQSFIFNIDAKVLRISMWHSRRPW